MCGEGFPVCFSVIDKGFGVIGRMGGPCVIGDEYGEVVG